MLVLVHHPCGPGYRPVPSLVLVSVTVACLLCTEANSGTASQSKIYNLINQ